MFSPFQNPLNNFSFSNKLVLTHASYAVCHALHVFVAWCVLAAGSTPISSSGNALKCRLLVITYSAVPGIQWLRFYFFPFCLHGFLQFFWARFLLQGLWVSYLMPFSEDFSHCGSHHNNDLEHFFHSSNILQHHAPSIYWGMIRRDWANTQLDLTEECFVL